MPAIEVDLSLHSRVTKLMGNRFEFSVVSDDQQVAHHFIDLAIAEVTRIEALLSTFKDDSLTSMVNAAAGMHPVKVNKEFFDLVYRSIKISSLTQGAFDLSYGSIDKRFWNFDTNMTALPDEAAAKRSVRLINFRNIILDEEEQTVFLKEKGMRIGFGGIGKGYAADRAKMILEKNGVKSGVVNAAGDLVTWGNHPDGRPWTVGLADPDSKRHHFSQLAIGNMAVATSGDYEKFVVINGKKYAHTIDPKTGFPVSGIKSVTIVCPSAELADAMATPVMVMGVRAGLHLINQMKQIACIIVDENDRVFTSKNINVS
jgi:thiamine biosynthesis lipoprotein